MEKKKTFINRWESDAFNNINESNQIYNDSKNKLIILPHDKTGWRCKPNQKLKTISINKNGLRNEDIGTLDKNKKNCLLIGGSVAWGFGSSSNEKMPSVLIEKILKNDYKINMNVINLAELGYNSAQELDSFIFSYHDLKPSIVIILSGENDIVLEENDDFEKNGQFELINAYLWMKKLGIFREKSFIKFVIKCLMRWFKKDEKINPEYFYLNRPNKGEIANFLYNRKNDFIKTFCEQKKIAVYNFLQPDLFFKNKKSNYELKYMEYLSNYGSEFLSDKIEKLNNWIKDENNNTNYFKNISLLDCFDKNEETIFFDRTHFTDKGNEIISRRICASIYNNYIKLSNL